MKVVKSDTTLITRYLRDASGNVMSIYKDTTTSETPIYGSSRLGQYKGGVIEGHRTLGHRNPLGQNGNYPRQKSVSGPQPWTNIKQTIRIVKPIEDLIN